MLFLQLRLQQAAYTTQMNILFICDEYPPGPNGGIGSITRSLATELAQQGHRVCIAGLYSYEFGGLDYEERDAVNVWRFRYGFRLGKSTLLYKLQRNLPAFLKRLLFAQRDFSRYCKALEEIIAAYRIDIIEHPDWISYGYNLGLKSVSLPSYKVPVILKLHGSRTYLETLQHQSVKPRFRKIDEQLLHRADNVVAVSRFTATVNEKIFQLPRSITVLYNGVQVPAEVPSNSRRHNTVVFAGSLVAQKGIFQLMKAWPLVLRQHPDAQLIVLGKGAQGPARELLSDTARQSVHFLGHQSMEEVRRQMQSASLAVLPSYSETFGLVAIEAMSTACPTIFTNRTAGPEIICDGAEGFLVDPDQVAEIAETIIKLLRDPLLRQRIGAAGRKKVLSEFDISICAAKHISHYQQVIQNYKCE